MYRHIAHIWDLRRGSYDSWSHFRLFSWPLGSVTELFQTVSNSKNFLCVPFQFLLNPDIWNFCSVDSGAKPFEWKRAEFEATSWLCELSTKRTVVVRKSLVLSTARWTVFSSSVLSRKKQKVFLMTRWKTTALCVVKKHFTSFLLRRHRVLKTTSEYAVLT